MQPPSSFNSSATLINGSPSSKPSKSSIFFDPTFSSYPSRQQRFFRYLWSFVTSHQTPGKEIDQRIQTQGQILILGLTCSIQQSSNQPDLLLAATFYCIKFQRHRMKVGSQFWRPPSKPNYFSVNFCDVLGPPKVP